MPHKVSTCPFPSRVPSEGKERTGLVRMLREAWPARSSRDALLEEAATPAPFCGYLELHPVAGVHCYVVRAFEEVVEGQRWVVAGVDVPFRV